MTLKLIKGGEEKREIVRCPKCKSSVFIEARHTMRRNGKRITAGQKAKACATCMAKGEVTLI